MAQFWTRYEKIEETLEKCLEQTSVENLFIRKIGSMGGDLIFRKDLNGETFEFTFEKDSEIRFFIEGEEVWRASDIGRFKKGFSIEFREPEGFNMPYLYVVTPDDEEIREDCLTCLRIVWEDQLVEISFFGKIKLERDGWYDKEKTWQMWRVK